MSCRTCQPLPDCTDSFDHYSLQDDVFFFVGNCPPGFSCNSSSVVTMLCCDGTQLTVTLPPDATVTFRKLVIQAMVTEAGRRMLFCDNPPTSPGGTGTGTETDPFKLYYSVPRSAVTFCPGGGAGFTATTQPGRFLAFDQAQADEAAYAEAQAQANRTYCCLNDLPNDICKGSAFSERLRATGPGATSANLWAISSGALPPGLTLPTGWRMGRSVTLSGTPTTVGSYTFSVRMTTTNHLTIQRTYTICVLEISTSSPLPDGNKDDAYSQTLSCTSCATTPLSWQLISGALPDGLLLDEETGVISGTPTEDGNFNFTIQVQTEAT
jgi:hypothetical protein